MYELSNGNTKDPKYRKMLAFHDQISDIYTDFKTRQYKLKNQANSSQEQSNSAKFHSTKIPSHVFGVQNIGNTCFFNSTMQALNATRELVDFYVSNQAMFEDDSLLMRRCCLKADTSNLNKRYSIFLKEGNEGTATSISPHSLWPGVCKLNPKYRSLNQQDAPELFRYFVDGLIEGETKVLKKKGQLSQEKVCYKKIETPTERIFGHYQAHRVTCLQCDYISWTFHLSSDINIDIDKEVVRQSRSNLKEEKDQAVMKVRHENDDLKALSKDGHYELKDGELIKFKEDPVPYFDPSKEKLFAPYNEKTSDDEVCSLKLENLLDNFFEREILNNVENYYTCYNCNKKLGEPKKSEVRFITKTFFLYNPGPVLAITLKRFKKSSSSYFSSWGGGFTKIDTQVDFPLTLDLSKYFLSRTYLLQKKIIPSASLCTVSTPSSCTQEEWEEATT